MNEFYCLNLLNKSFKEYKDFCAIVENGIETSYQELFDFSDKIAGYLSHLLSKNISNTVSDKLPIIAICLQRGLSSIATMIAAWKLNCAFVNLDISTKQDKKTSLFFDCQPLLIVTEETIQNAKDFVESAHFDTHILENPQNIAYVIYTSGTTGKPKGIKISHFSLSSFIKSLKDFYCFLPKERMLHYSSLNFDASIWEIFGALSSGLTLIPRPDQNHAGGQELCSFLSFHEINHCLLSPLVFETLGNSFIPSLKTLTLGGDVFPKKDISSWLSYCRLYNAYGPSEITVCATITEITKSLTDSPSYLGHSLPHLSATIVDDNLQSVQKGHVGELLLAGLSLSNGYLNNEEQNQKNFILFNGKRFYKTGDLMQHDADGGLIYIGRKDRQVKISSIRIELPEMEQRVSNINFVKRSVVLNFEQNLIKYLVLYLSIDPLFQLNEAFMKSEIRKTLQSYYPPEVCPRSIFIVNEFPLNTSGKIDIQYLSQLQMNVASNKIPQDSNITEQFIHCLKKYIVCEDILIEQTFFELGGDSLNAILFIEDLHHLFSYQIKLFELFEIPIKSIFSEIKNMTFTERKSHIVC